LQDKKACIRGFEGKFFKKKFLWENMEKISNFFQVSKETSENQEIRNSETNQDDSDP